ncbi:hypothetical protein N7478_002600 [Penicillium angulare]|uniref:uncharacterized protein n=1 Tax=Penicillium angulare TaxID=116970 RepID=UPI00253FD87F|nr:uncharacterized protein N7478_002600 [Penicillium angulare]KAJ5286914.1 hypothetical protein N7478_002600 [Penicillium angulare]
MKRYWYEPILPEEAVFPESCRRTLTHFVTTISSHLSRKRTEETFLQFLTNSSSIIIVFLNELAAAFATAGSASTETSSIVERYLENAPDSSLANVLSKEQQRKKLNMIADDILSNYLDSKTYRCSPARDFLREVFARVVLESTVISLSRPEFINEWIIYLLQDGESEIMHAIDAGVEGARNQGVSAGKVPNEPKNVPSESATGQTLAQPAERRTGQVDEATEKALREAKRLSALIASQDVENTVPESQPQCRQNTDTSSSDPNNKAELPSKWMPEDQRGDVGVGAISPEPQRPMAPSHREVSVSPVSLHGAQVMVDDDAAGSEKGTVKSKPTWDYLLQVEPTSTRSTGWMVFRKYTDFQSVHEMLETVARLNRIQSFSEQFPTLPAWKGKTRHELARELERYLQEAVKHESLAETNRMRQFLEKERGSNEVDVTTKSGFSFPSQSAFENVGKGVLGALTNAPKGVAGGGRAVFDGVTGVFGGSGHSRKPTNTLDQRSEDQQIASKSEYEVPASFGSAGKPSALESYDHLSALQNGDGSASRSITSPAASATESSRVETHKSSVGEAGNGQDTGFSESTLVQSESRQSTESSIGPARMQDKWFTGRTSPPLPSDTRPSNDFDSTPQSIRRQQQPITADETQIAVELIFAVINELYTLSSAWNIRRTLLNAAKSYILRPASPTLETIRTLLQESMIESHTSDDALSEYLKKLRENALPTEAELLAWPPPATEEEKEQLRIKARRLFVQRGIPQALTSVMGAAASREALEKIFDSLQVQSVAQGFVFSVLLQGLRVLAL